MEAAQSRLTDIAGSRDDTYREDYARTADTAVLDRNRDELMGSAARSFAGPSFGGETFEDDVAWELERLRAVGIKRVVAVDLTVPEFGIPVVRIVIPGLEFQREGTEYASGPRAKAALARWIEGEIALRQTEEQSE